MLSAGRKLTASTLQFLKHCQSPPQPSNLNAQSTYKNRHKPQLRNLTVH